MYSRSRRAKSKIIFVCSLIVFTGIWYILGMQQVFSFDFFDRWTATQNVKIGEGFVRESTVDNTVIGTVIAQLSLGNGSFSVRPSAGNIDQLFLNSQILVNTDLLALVTSSQNPETAIRAHIAHSEETLAEIRNVSQQLDQEAISYLEKSKECLVQKRQGDQIFFRGMQQSDSRMSQEGLEQSLEFAPCYITNRIQANAQTFLSQKVQANAYVLQQRLQLLQTNIDTFLQHSGYFEGTILEELLVLKRQLQQVNNVTYEQFASSFDFSFDYLDFNYRLPTYDQFVIWPNGIPTFENPGFDRINNSGRSFY